MGCGLSSKEVKARVRIFLPELEVDSPKSLENGEGGRLIAPQEAFNRIAEAVHEAIRKMDMAKKKKLQIEELERTVRLKVAEADVFQLKAKEAKREAERLQRIAPAKTDKSKEEYTSSYLKLHLSETEAEKQYLFEKIKSQKSSRASQTSGSGDPVHILGYSKIHDLLHSYNVSSKSESQPSECHHH
ncbi:hypothetical protein Tsubulata_048413 [Turnera subulata]|uniref:Oberon coiled-coil region domain-containing protein n=1 Tax=Turnera subulata TaxID=218843 RepID=A0A9Q0EYJ0_9ROSI|nr:hypothetical protein Tsubulata_048413 [Turnera subulata]